MREYNQTEYRKADRRSRKAVDRERNRNWLNSLKESPCSSCGNSYPPEAMD